MKNYCIFSIIISLSVFIRSFNAFNCHLPFGCRMKKIYPRDFMDFNEKGTTKVSSILCEVKDYNFTFKFPEPTPQITNDSCNINSDNKHEQRIIIRRLSKEIGFLERQFNFTNALRYFKHFSHPISLFILSFNGFDLNFLEFICKLDSF